MKDQYTANLRLAIPVIISQVGQFSVQLADTMMVGHLDGPIPLAAISLAYALSWPVLLFGTGVAMGITPLVGKSSARKNRLASAGLFKNSLALGLAVSLVMMLLLGAIVPLMGYLGQAPEVIPIARGYMYYQIASILPVMFFACCRQFLEGVGNTRRTMNITIAGNVLNVALNFALIYGWWIFPEMGAVGAGAATFISRVIMAGLFAWVFLHNPVYRGYLGLFRRVKFDLPRMRRLANIGIPIALLLGIETSAMSLMVVVIGMFGAAALAAHQVAVNLPILSFMVVVGLSAATTIRVSQSYGLRQYAQMRQATHASLHLITLFTIIAASTVWFFSRPIAGLFTQEPEVIRIAAQLLHYGALFMIIDGFQGVTLGALRGITEVKQPMYYAILTYGCICLPLGYLLSFVWGMGPAGTWVAFIVGLATLGIGYYRLFIRCCRQLEQGVGSDRNSQPKK